MQIAQTIYVSRESKNALASQHWKKPCMLQPPRSCQIITGSIFLQVSAYQGRTRNNSHNAGKICSESQAV